MNFSTNKLIVSHSHSQILIWISIGLSVFRFVANEYKWRAIWLHSIRNIRSAIRLAIMKVILNCSPLPIDYELTLKVLITIIEGFLDNNLKKFVNGVDENISPTLVQAWLSSSRFRINDSNHWTKNFNWKENQWHVQ